MALVHNHQQNTQRKSNAEAKQQGENSSSFRANKERGEIQLL